ncbi:YesL family protein [Alkalicoccus urumqiensis]|uniref:DUF624 domain-containing protein n=1 Tax=Alkalicoccus urumqiensis TaxID=1548213 RepID=A0A2P6MLT2_ALKUR|nr:DUF624 domain-containing protein [Alkalicoccus urumqiensis]PRO67257.1 hypothetical protein C6I21_01465 [Alkalicoccus urumqiensis]
MIVSRLEEVFRFVSRFAALNILWIAFSVAGLGVLGVFPATFALFASVQHWMRVEEPKPVHRVFTASFKEYFFKANAYGYLFAGAGVLLYFNYFIMQNNGLSIPLPVTLAFLSLVLVYFLMLIVFIPVSVYYNRGLMASMKLTIQFIFGKLHVAVLLGVIIWGGAYLSLAFPALLVFFSGSVLAYMLMWFFNQTIEKIEMNHLQTKN